MTDTQPVAKPERGRPADEVGRKDRRGRLRGMMGRSGLYYRQVVAELRKVIWPTRKELVSYTWVVLLFVLVMISFVSTADYGFSKLILKIFG